jgi:FMN-dependent NADH-azoreductase
MPTQLRQDSSPLETSVSRALTEEYLYVWKAAHTDGVVIVRDPIVAPPQPINAAWIGASFTPPPQRSAGEQKRLGRTFAHPYSGPQGLLRGKKTTILAATGGVYSAGTPAAGMNFLDPYLKAVLGFMGVRNVEVITAGGTSQLRRPDVDREVFLRSALELVRQAIV